jgi:hypothetical protein
MPETDEVAAKARQMTWHLTSQCAAVLLLLPAVYLGSYWLLLLKEPSNSILIEGQSLASDGHHPDSLIIIPPEPKPCIREEYVIGGDGVKLFFRPANRLHRVIDRCLP